MTTDKTTRVFWPVAPDGYIPNSTIRSWLQSQKNSKQPQPQPPKSKPVFGFRETDRERGNEHGWLPMIGVPQKQKLHLNKTTITGNKDNGSFKSILKGVSHSHQIYKNASSIDSNKMEESKSKRLRKPSTAVEISSSVREIRNMDMDKRAVPQTHKISIKTASSVKNPNKMEESKSKRLVKLPKIVPVSQHSEATVRKASSIRALKKMDEDKKFVPQTFFPYLKNASSIGDRKNEEVKKGSSSVFDRLYVQNVSLSKVPGRETNTPKLPKIVPVMSPLTVFQKPISPLIISPAHLYRRQNSN